MPKIWISETEYIEMDDRRSLSADIACRSRSLDWMGMFGYLPDPDPILKKTGHEMTVYRSLLADAHVWSCVQSRKSGTLSCQWGLAGAGSRNASAADRNMRVRIERVLAALDVDQVISDMLDAFLFGISPIEVIWNIGGSGQWERRGPSPPGLHPTAVWWLPQDLVGRPPEWFVFGADNDLRFLSRDHAVRGEALPARKFLLARHHASYRNPYGERTLSRCYWPVTFKRGGLKFWAMFTEKFGMPWVVGRVPRQTNDTERGRVLAALADMVQDAVAVINDDESIEFPEAKNRAASAEVYERLIVCANREISKAILGQTLTTELDRGGSLAATREHMEVRADLIDQDKRMVKAGFDRLFRWIAELNDPEAEPPVFQWFEEEGVRKDRAERDEILSRQGLKLARAYYLRTYDLLPGDVEEGPSTTLSPWRGGTKASSEGSPLPMNFAAFGEKGRGDGGLALDGTGKQLDYQTIDSGAVKAAASAQQAMNELIGLLLKAFRRTKSPEEIRETLDRLSPGLDTADLQDVLARALFASGLTGYAAASEDHEK
ncbi:MAG: DUF935 domain-containing protein [Proteobacteria bacterium]|nr:DUF935 domain-containing protein [Pseudomonadota bacterium]